MYIHTNSNHPPSVNSIQDGLLLGCLRMGAAAKSSLLPKICHTYPRMMKLVSYTLPKKDPKNIWITWHTSWILLATSIFHWKPVNFFWVFKGCLIKKVKILMMSAKMATSDLLEKKVFWNKDYDVIIYVHDVSNKNLSRDSNYIVEVVMWPTFGDSRISMREVI